SRAGRSSFSERDRKGLSKRNKIRSIPNDRSTYKISVNGFLSSKVLRKYRMPANRNASNMIKAILQVGYDISMKLNCLYDSKYTSRSMASHNFYSNEHQK